MSETALTEREKHPFLRKACDASAGAGAVVLVGMAMMTVVSVVGRSFFGHPILGDVELVQLGCAVVVSCFLPYTQFQRANIIVDFFTQNATSVRKRWMDSLGNLLYTLMMALVVWRVATGGLGMKDSGESSMLMNLPLWWAYALMLPGLSLATLIGAIQTLNLLSTRPTGEVEA